MRELRYRIEDKRQWWICDGCNRVCMVGIADFWNCGKDKVKKLRCCDEQVVVSSDCPKQEWQEVEFGDILKLVFEENKFMEGGEQVYGENKSVSEC